MLTLSKRIPSEVPRPGDYGGSADYRRRCCIRSNGKQVLK
jgi:hypothetical protein